MAKTLFDKVWDSHVIEKIKDGPDVLFIDRHFIHEVTSPVAFVGLKNRGLKVMFPDKTFATADHNTPTINQHLPIKDKLSAMQVKTLEKIVLSMALIFGDLVIIKMGLSMLLVQKWYNSARTYNCMWRFSYIYSWCIWSYCIWYRNL